MKKKEFMKIAKECIEESMKPLAFDANLAMQMNYLPPMIKNRLERYLKLKEALEYIENE